MNNWSAGAEQVFLAGEQLAGRSTLSSCFHNVMSLWETHRGANAERHRGAETGQVLILTPHSSPSEQPGDGSVSELSEPGHT